MKIADQRHPASQHVEALADARNRSGGFQGIDGHAHHLRAGIGELLYLAHGGADVDGVGIGHRLHHYGRIAADQNMANPHLAGYTAGDG
jgi:hypothetical protein